MANMNVRIESDSMGQIEVGADNFSLRRGHHLGERISLDVLHAGHARPPPREVVGIANDLPQLGHGRGDGTAATRGGHDR